MADWLFSPLPELRGVPFEGMRFDGERLSGILLGVDAEHALFHLRGEGRQELTKIPFGDLRQASFRGAISPEGRRQLLQRASSERLTATDRLVITFRDGKSAEYGPCHFKQERGLHLFLFPEGNTFVRIFVPREGLERVSADPVGDLAHCSLFEWARPSIASRADLARFLELLDLSNRVRKIPPQRRLGEILLQDRVVTSDQVRDVLALQGKVNKRLGELLIEAGMVSEDELYLCLAHQMRVPFVRLVDFDFPAEADKWLKAEVARKGMAVPLMEFRGSLVVAVADPLDSENIGLLRFASGKPILPVLATRADLKRALDRLYAGVDFSQTLRQLSPELEQDKEILGAETLQLHEADEPIVRLVNDMLVEAIRKGASDIHLRPGETQLELLYRIDGSMVPIGSFPSNLLPAVVGRIKIIGNMDISEHRRPQDGQIRFKSPLGVRDMRVSVLPTVCGESVVIRVLAGKANLKSLDQLGFSESDLDYMREILDKSFGMFLVTGPTGSGKSTTLYSCLRELRAKNLNIITVEDPVEFRIEGIEQVQARADIGLTFAMALRQILRHDPDAILIGEIRDQETAEIAVKSALTGHIVLSTLHTNNAVGAITRLRDIGIPSYLLASTLLGVLAQRLVRTNCLQCMEEEAVDPLVRKVMGVGEDELFMRGKGCDECNGTGYKGRTTVYELLRVTPELQNKITLGAGSEELTQQALADGMVPLTRNALELARLYKTSLAEAYRVRLD